MKLNVEVMLNSPERAEHATLTASDWEYELAFRILLGLGRHMFSKIEKNGQIAEAWKESDGESEFGYLKDKASWKRSGSPMAVLFETWSDEERAGARVVLEPVPSFGHTEFGLLSWLDTFHAGTCPDVIEIKFVRAE